MSRRRVLVKSCRRCGSDYHPTHTIQSYCSHACRWEAERERNDARLRRPCPHCGKEFRRSIGQKFCSQSCGVSAYHASNRKTRLRSCIGCSESFTPYPSALNRGAGRYCSRACYRKVVGQRLAIVEVTCTACGKPFRRTQAAIRRVKSAFCSRLCATAYNTGERHVAFRGGEAHRRGPGWVRNRRLARERDKVCRACGKTPEENGQALSVDHTIPWRLFKDEVAANDLNNLISLCRSCHARKTVGAEQKYMKGDVLDYRRHLVQVGLPDPFEVPA